MGSEQRRRRAGEHLRKKILNAARQLFVARGYEAVTMREIARKIEYSPTAIYLHFKDKHAVINALCAADFQSLSRSFQKIARVADPVERLRRTGRAYAEFGLRYPNHYRLMFMTPHPALDPDEAGIDKGDSQQDAYAFLKATIAAGVKAGRYRPGLTDIELIAQTVWAGVHGVVALHIAKARDPWVDWRAIKRRIAIMTDTLIDGLTVRRS